MKLSTTAPLTLAMAGATLAPVLLAYNQTPAATLYNQLLAVFGWGLVLLLVRGHWDSRLSAWPLLAAASLLVFAMLKAPVTDAAGLLLLSAGSVLLLVGVNSPRAEPLAEGFAAGLLLAGLLSFAIGAVQVFAPAWADGQWIARSGFVGRAVGNVRQPNHLATLLLMAAVGLILLAQRRRWPTAICVALMAALIGAVVLSASRTGLWFGVPLLLLWGLVDRSLEPRLRWLLIATPLLAGLAWLGMHLWAASGLGVFGAEQRLDREGAGSPSRVKILLNAWSLLMQEPGGVGWGGFNRAWTLSPFPDRPIAFFDHTHNLPMQLLVELGWAWGGLVLLLLSMVAGQALLAAWRARGEAAPLQRAALMLALIVAVHSMLEYPLWYAYFLLPT
ncbi:MAG: O-antigen ligase family protein, partial [Inhella sp.]